MFAGAQEHLHILRSCLLPSASPISRASFCIPAVRHCRGRRKTGGRQGRVEPQVVARPLLLADSMRSVRTEDGQDAQTGNFPGLPDSLSAENGRLSSSVICSTNSLCFIRFPFQISGIFPSLRSPSPPSLPWPPAPAREPHPGRWLPFFQVSMPTSALLPS